MKKMLVFAVFLLFSVSFSIAQINDSTLINYQYCEIIGNKPFMSSKMKITINYGNDGDAENTIYKSMVESLNDLSIKGWLFVQAYTAPVNNGNNMYYCWILKRQIKK